MPRITSPFVLDLRSIAVFRMLLGVTMLYDVAARIPFAKLFLSDQGAFTRADYLELFHRPWSFSIYMLASEPIQAQALLVIHGLAAIALAVGYRTRLANIVCWILLISLQNRNPLVLNGGDTLLRVYVFWALFLPINARFSLDRALAGDDAEPFATNRYHSVNSFALVAQTVFVYAFTWILKSGELWRNGEAVGYVLSNLGLTTAGGSWLSHYSRLYPVLTRLTFHWEWLGLVLLLCPWRNAITRLAAIAGFIAMHIGFALTLDLALFPMVSILGWIALLPSAFWDRFGRWTPTAAGQFARRLRGRLSGGAIVAPGTASSVCAAVAIALVFLWNVASVPGSPLRNRVPVPIENTLHLLKLQQKWSMFAANPPRHSIWYTVEAQLVDGNTYDLLYPSALYTLRPPETFTERLPDRRWGKFLSQIGKRRYRSLRRRFLEYFVDRWNASSPADRQIETAKLVAIKTPIQLVGKAGKPEILTLDALRVANVAQLREPIAPDEGTTDDVVEPGLDSDENLDAL